MKLLYPIDDDAVEKAVWAYNLSDASVRSKLYATMNVEARAETKKNSRARAAFRGSRLFPSVLEPRAKCDAEGHRQVDRSTVASAESSILSKREKVLAAEALTRYGLVDSNMIEFIEHQTDWWTTAGKRGPKRIAAEYKRNIEASVRLYRLVTGETFEAVAQKVKSSHGYFRPVLEVVFPSWLEEQRDIAERSLWNWARRHLVSLPAPFPDERI